MKNTSDSVVYFKTKRYETDVLDSTSNKYCFWLCLSDEWAGEYVFRTIDEDFALTSGSTLFPNYFNAYYKHRNKSGKSIFTYVAYNAQDTTDSASVIVVFENEEQLITHQNENLNELHIAKIGNSINAYSQEKSILQIYDMMGQMVVQKSFQGLIKHEFNGPEGMYIVRVKSKQNTVSKKYVFTSY